MLKTTDDEGVDDEGDDGDDDSFKTLLKGGCETEGGRTTTFTWLVRRSRR